MTEIILTGKLKQHLSRTSSQNSKMYHIYQFETMNNHDYIEIIDVYSQNLIPAAKVGADIEIPVVVSLRDNSILFEVKTNNLKG
ncbi:hypothetical protein ACH5BF_02140 [Arcobacter sp. YIC-464]|uniref:hypothetical protein n=1 Tax=Arcobacter sp. YIC-464 TaxID=3376631 RepID=UPI003C1B1E22